MPKISYVLTPPVGEYEQCKADLAPHLGAYDRINFDDEAKTITFPYSDGEIFPLKLALKGEKWGEFLSHPKDYKTLCTRYCDDLEESYLEARAKSNEAFGKITARENNSTLRNVVIGETHEDIAVKKQVAEFLHDEANRGAVLVLENMGSVSANEDLAAWLSDNNPDSKLPKNIVRIIDLTAQNYAAQAAEHGTPIDEKEMREALSEIFGTAKENSVALEFVENDLTLPDDLSSRHAALGLALDDVQKRHPQKRIIMLAGALHEDKSQKLGASFSEIIGGDSCHAGKEFSAWMSFNKALDLIRNGKPAEAKEAFSRAKEQGFNEELARSRLHDFGDETSAKKIIAQEVIKDFFPRPQENSTQR